MKNPNKYRFALLALFCWALLVVAGFWLSHHSAQLAPSTAQRERARLRQSVSTLEEEIDYLRRQLHLKQRLEDEIGGGFRFLSARLTAIPDLSPQRRTAMIDIGSEDGVEAGFGVVSEFGIVGRISEVGARRSRILLADDPGFHVRFMSSGPPSGEGIAHGSGSRGRLESLLQKDSFRLYSMGEQLITTGNDGVFPRGLVIGRVDEVISARWGPRIAVPVDPMDIRSVQVLVPPQKTQKTSPTEIRRRR